MDPLKCSEYLPLSAISTQAYLLSTTEEACLGSMTIKVNIAIEAASGVHRDLRNNRLSSLRQAVFVTISSETQ